ncbi:hypothetical protein [Ahrensia sp. 13_GOM-1096m]|uniref:hypothetical protein n=1 Tax=Ahrensia sp. 13_GOM-1096m TaxID=1380380 RepID=UPI00047BCD14|nr:hypothetical protein [Ahrensia sp. 13_GOM-1096m]
MAQAQDLARIKRNVSKMVGMNAPEVDIDAYIAQEGTTIDVIRAFKPQTLSTGADAAQQFGENFNRGVYSLINAPTAIANAGMSAIGADYRFKRPLQAIAPSLDETIMQVPEAQTAVGRVAGTVGEFVGANTLPAGGMIAAAPKIAAATANATGLLGQSANRMAAGVAAAPATAATGELVSTVGAGIGAQVARDSAPNSATAELVASTIGGIAAPAAIAVSPINLARKGVSAVAKRVSPKELEKAQRRQISDGIRQNLTPEGEAAVRESAQLQQTIPNYRPSIAEATESPAFIATQREFEGGLSGPDLDAANQRYRQNQIAVDDAATSQAPQSSLLIDDVFAQARKRPERTRSMIDAKVSQLDDAARAQAEDIAPRAQRSTIGASIRDQIEYERDYTKGQLSQDAQSMGLNSIAQKYDFSQPVKQQLIQAVKPRSGLADNSALPRGILSDIQAMGDSVSVTDLMALRSRITDDIRTYTARPDGRRKVEYLETLKSALDSVSDQIVRKAGDSRIADNMQTFRQRYRDQVVQPFEQGAIGKVRKKDLAGAYRIPDEEVAKEFFNGWSQTAAKQFRETFKNAPNANSTMEAAAIDDLFSSAVLDGQIDPNRLAMWTRRNAGVLQEFPDIAGRVKGLQDAVDSIAKRRAILTSRRRKIEESYLSRELSKLDNPTGSTTPESVIDAAIKNPARMRKLLSSVKTTESKDAIARHVWETALSQTDPSAFIKRNGFSVQAALGKDKYTAATRLARAIEKNKLVRPPAGRAMDTNPMAALENSLGTGLNQMSSRVFAVKSGRTSARYAFADIAGRAFRTMTANQARQTLQDAIYDPQVAIDLANALEMNALSQPAAKRLYTFLLSNGIVAANGGDRHNDN